MRYKTTHCALSVLAVFCLVGCTESSPATAPNATRLVRDASTPLGESLEAMSRNADLGTDAKFERLSGKTPSQPRFIPADMRQVMTDWPPKRRLSSRSHGVRFSIRNDRIWMPFEGRITTPDDEDILREQFDSAMQAMGYRLVQNKEPLAQLAQRLGEPADFFEQMCNIVPFESYVRVYVRKVGETELVVYSETNDTVGSREWDGRVEFQWFVIHAYAHSEPTLAELWKTLPGWCQPAYFGESISCNFAQQPVTAFQRDDSVSVTFQQPGIYDQLVKAMEAEGYEFRQEYPLHRRTGRIQRDFNRFADAAGASISIHVDDKTCRLVVREPRHKGPPLTERPRRKPDIARLPREKRPTVSLDQLAFAAPELRETVRRLDEHIGTVSDESWAVRGYRDGRFASEPWSPRYDAYWQSRDLAKPDRPAVQPDARPYRHFMVNLSGPDPGEGEAERLKKLSFRSSWVPRNGWVAKVSVGRNLESKSIGAPIWFSVSVDWTTEQTPYLFGGGFTYGDYKISLEGQQVSAGANGQNNIKYRYKFRPASPTLNTPEKAKAHFRSRVQAVYSSPESLRDHVLAQLESSRKGASAGILNLEGLSALDYTHAATDSPPMDVSVKDHPPGEEIQEKLLEQVNAELDRREKLIREQYEAIHAAIVKALSLEDLQRIMGMEL